MLGEVVAELRGRTFAQARLGHAREQRAHLEHVLGVDAGVAGQEGQVERVEGDELDALVADRPRHDREVLDVAELGELESPEDVGGLRAVQVPLAADLLRIGLDHRVRTRPR